MEMEWPLKVSEDRRYSSIHFNFKKIHMSVLWDTDYNGKTLGKISGLERAVKNSAAG